MNLKSFPVVLTSGACAALVCSCASVPKPVQEQQIAESVVCIGEEPAALAWLPAPGQPVRVRSTYLPSADTIEYASGRDYWVDFAKGTLRRTPGSRLPDFRTNLLYGRQDFDHTKFPGFGNRGFFAFVDYSFVRTTAWPVQAPQADLLKRTRARLAGGEAVKIVAFGDSITAGGDATQPELIFWNRWADELRSKYPAARITVQNGATIGDSTAQGLERLQAKVLAEKPDLVLIGFGMNDHNTMGVPVPQFEQNLKQMIARVRRETGAEVILFSAFPPNSKWRFGTHRMQEYASATERVARKAACAYADVFGNWQALAARKKPEDLLGNNINHPNDFGHWIYYRVLSAMNL
jgi:lysophospholipase L1-like esterase